MKVLIPNEGRFLQTPDGAVWTRGSSKYEFWLRYLDVFDAALVVARVGRAEALPDQSYRRADGLGIEFLPLPYYHGPQEYLRRRSQVLKAIQTAARRRDAVILRAHGQVASAFKSAMPPGRPYGLEIVGDSRDVFAKGSIDHPLRRLFQWWFGGKLRSMAKDAVGVSYVTASTLQERYPASDNVYTTHYSSIELHDRFFADMPRELRAPDGSIHLVTVGSLELMYKGIDVLLEALALIRPSLPQLTLTVVGDGKHRSELEAMSAQLGLEDVVQFVGQLPSSEAVAEHLDHSDVFVLPSRTEGLPRAMIEAMARGLPCIGTRVGGIPELLESDYLVPANDAGALAAKIKELVADPQRMSDASSRNLAKAREYRLDVLRQRRIEFYSHIKQVTAEWQGTKK